MAHWAKPAGTAGDIRLIRTNLAAARADPRDCPLARASEARPLLRPEPSPPEAEKPLQDFTLKVLMDALDLIECDRRPVQWVMEQLWRTRGTFGRSAAPPCAPWPPGVDGGSDPALPGSPGSRPAVAAAGRAPSHLPGPGQVDCPATGWASPIPAVL